MSQSASRRARRATGKHVTKSLGLLQQSLHESMNSADEQSAMGDVWRTLGDEERAKAWHKIAAAHMVMADALVGLLTLGPNEKGEW